MKLLSAPLSFAVGFCAMMAGGWLGLPHLLYQQQAQPAQFNHVAHKEKAGMKCDDCHAIGDDGRFAGIPSTEQCAGCHAQPAGDTKNEKFIIASYITPAKEIPWRVYSRQPINVRFPHAVHVKRAKLACERCHGNQGNTTMLAAYEQNRISGYSRNIWGHNIARVGLKPGDGMKMSDCERCHEEKGVQAGCLGCHQ